MKTKQMSRNAWITFNMEMQNIYAFKLFENIINFIVNQIRFTNKVVFLRGFRVENGII